MNDYWHDRLPAGNPDEPCVALTGNQVQVLLDMEKSGLLDKGTVVGVFSRRVTNPFARVTPQLIAITAQGMKRSNARAYGSMVGEWSMWRSLHIKITKLQN
jgi:hypothetical protein